MGCAQSSPSDSSVVVSTSDVKVQQHAVPTIDCEVLFFPDKALPCRNFMRAGALCRRPNCTYAHERTSLMRLLEVIDGAKKSLEVCVFTITCNEIADAIESAAKRGVMVRIITDDEQAKSQGSDVARLSKVTNVSVRHDGDSKSHMHHKFAVVDAEVLINGSFNWTRAAVITNRENVVITRNAPVLVQSFREEFNSMWTQYQANTRIPA